MMAISEEHNLTTTALVLKVFPMNPPMSLLVMMMITMKLLMNPGDDIKYPNSQKREKFKTWWKM